MQWVIEVTAFFEVRGCVEDKLGHVEDFREQNNFLITVWVVVEVARAKHICKDDKQNITTNK